MKIKWEDPGGARPGPPLKYQAFVDELKKHPGQWAVLAEGHRSHTGVTLWRQKGTYGKTEFTCRKQSDGTWTIYARWPK